jgi:DNA processing protein
MISSDSTLAWYVLFRTKGLGPRTLNATRQALLRAGLSLDTATYLSWPEFHAIVPQIPRSAYDSLQQRDGGAAWQEYQHLVEQGIEVIAADQPEYPQQACERLGADTPPLLFCRGYVSLLRARSVAIVGSRHADPESRAFASRLSGQLALVGVNVVSGYAAGIDSDAHIGALQQEGTTTMVLSAGILDFRRKAEYRSLPWDGSVLAVSQFQPRERWLARNAMARNKLVCALAQAVVVVQSGPRVDAEGRMSGTFNAGEAALALGIPLFVLEPPSGNGTAPGNADLIRMGGRPVTPDSALQAIVAAGCNDAEYHAPAIGTAQQAKLF